MPSKKHKVEEEKMEEETSEVEPGAPAMTEPVAEGEPGAPTMIEPAMEVPAIIPEEEIAQLRTDLEAAQAKASEYLDGWQRERAEFYNYKKRMERELSQGGQNAFGNAIRRYLDIADDLARALKNKNRPKEGEEAVWADGIDLIHKKLIGAFEADGIKMIDTDGKFFDPNLHEAISHEDSAGHESGQIIEVVQPGYMLGERVIRPARVRVAR
ncbi:MAG: nucleotide exchange factor GrpE [Acidobacteriaceae bacterium]